MGVLKEVERVLLNGKRENSASTHKKGSVISRVGSFLSSLGGGKSPRIIVKIPLNRPIGKVFYTVESDKDPVTFNKRKDAEQFKKLLAVSVAGIKSDIVRREVTEEGYEPTYGDRK